MDSANFRLVAKCLNQVRYRMPPVMINDKLIRWNINLHSISRDSSNINKVLLRVCLQKKA
jgi:hypothetical protein